MSPLARRLWWVVPEVCGRHHRQTETEYEIVVLPKKTASVHQRKFWNRNNISTKLVHERKHLPYNERLKYLK